MVKEEAGTAVNCSGAGIRGAGKGHFCSHFKCVPRLKDTSRRRWEAMDFLSSINTPEQSRICMQVSA